MPAKPSCIVILVHGVGNQKKTWSQEFRQALKAELGSAAARAKLVDAYWAPLSTVKDVFHPTLAATFGTTGIALEDEAYRRAVLEFSRMLAAEAGAPVDAHSFGPGDAFEWVKSKLEVVQELVVDVGNYVARNGVRTAVQNVVHARLGETDAGSPDAPVVLVSHSQGTIICYDALRQAGANYANLRTWITMGSPLRKYFAFPLQWGRQQLGMPANVRWLNLYDKQDPVGKDLRDAVTWPKPQPEDRVVDNKKNAKDAHDHWHNPQVVKAVADEIRSVLA
jgi:hypothetical protein